MDGILAVIISQIIWGAAPPVFKYALEGIPPLTLAFVRNFFAGLLFLPLLIRYWKPISKKDWPGLLLGAFWGIFINLFFFLVGLKYAPSINVHVISSLAPIFLYFLSLMILKEKPHKEIIRGIAVSLLGVFIIVLGPLIVKGTVSDVTYSGYSMIVGNIFFVISMLGTVFHTIYHKRVLKTVNVHVVTAISFLFSALLFFPFMLYELQSWSFSQLTDKSVVGILYGVFGASAIAYFCYNIALLKLNAQEIGIYTYITPIIAVIVAIPLVHEYPDIFFIVGTVLVFLGIFISKKYPHFREMHKRMHKGE